MSNIESVKRTLKSYLARHFQMNLYIHLLLWDVWLERLKWGGAKRYSR